LSFSAFSASWRTRVYRYLEQRTLNLVTVWGLAAAFCALVMAGPLCLGWTTVFLMRAAGC
jgi:hypothetical protein